MKIIKLVFSGVLATIILTSAMSFVLADRRAPQQEAGGLPGPLRDFLGDMRLVQGAANDQDRRGVFAANRLPIPSEQLRMTDADSALLWYNEPHEERVSSYLIGAHEITNKEWGQFYNHIADNMGTKRAKRYLPDEEVWTTDFGIGSEGALAGDYFLEERFQNYPVVGVNWKQIQDFCEWKTNQLNELLDRYPKIERLGAFRLPTEAEWEYAALALEGNRNDRKKYFPWGSSLTNASGKYACNFGEVRDANNMVVKAFNADDHYYMGPVGYYAPNALGLHDMSGNVAEWTNDIACPIPNNRINMDAEDSADSLMYKIVKQYKRLDVRPDTTKGSSDRKILDEQIGRIQRDMKICYGEHTTRIVKGGSFANPAFYIAIGSRQAYPQHKTSAAIGFRIILPLKPELVKYFQ